MKTILMASLVAFTISCGDNSTSNVTTTDYTTNPGGIKDNTGTGSAGTGTTTDTTAISAPRGDTLTNTRRGEKRKDTGKITSATTGSKRTGRTGGRDSLRR